MLRSALIFATACFALLCNGCGGGYGCAAVVSPGVVTRIVDSETGTPIADGAVATLKGDGYTETMRPYESTYSENSQVPGILLSLAGAYGRTGDYTVRVERDGYEPFEQNVRVTRDVCGANTREVPVSLKRIAP